MFEKFAEKTISLESRFKKSTDKESVYHEMIDMGRSLRAMDPALKTPINKVAGCQSEMYLHAIFENGLLTFTADADALISKGIAALLIHLYSGTPPEYIIKNPPTVLETIGISNSLSPNRSNGLRSLYLKMQQLSIYYLTKQPH